MRVVITGATGAVGHAIIEECIKHGDQVLVVCHRNSNRINSIPENNQVKLLMLDLNEYSSFERQNLENDCLDDYDVFFHLAWNGTTGDERENVDVQYQNIGYALDAVLLAKKLGCHTFVGTGSQAEYGRVEGKLSPETGTYPETGYGIAKLSAGFLTRKLCEQNEMKHVWVRILSVYGPYDGENSMVISTIRKLLAREVPLFTPGEQKWDYIYSGDAAEAIYHLSIDGRDGEVYTLGSGRARYLFEYIHVIRNAVDPTGKAELGIGKIPYADGQVMYLCADTTKLEKDIGFFAQTRFEDGVKKTVKYCLEHKLT